MCYISVVIYSLPLQVRLSVSKMYPVSQEHSNEPRVLVHVWLHPPLSAVRHSFTSVEKKLLTIIEAI